MADAPAAGESFDVSCPHCGKSFRANVIPGAAPRYAGFKCTHCRLFVPYERADERDLLDAAD